MSGYGITGIGNSPLGTIGLGVNSPYVSYPDSAIMGMNPYLMGGTGMNGAYSSYADSTMRGMNSYMMGGAGMIGMYPTYMTQMAQANQDIEKMQLNHTGAMHQLQLQNKTQAFSQHDRAIFEQAMVDAGVNDGIFLLEKMVKKGDTKGAYEEYKKLETTLYQKYGDYFAANKDKINPSVYVRNFISMLYGKIISAQRQEVVSLESDFDKYGESAFTHGFMKSWKGKDYHDDYTEQLKSRIFGTNIDNMSHNERMQKLGGYVEAGVEGAAAMAVGAVALPTALGVGKWLLGISGTKQVVDKCGGEKITQKIAKSRVFNSKIGRIGAFLALGADILWQYSRA